MKTLITYITEDGKEFNDVFQARRHECELTEHRWDYYAQNNNIQKEFNSETKFKFCKNCCKQENANHD